MFASKKKSFLHHAFGYHEDGISYVCVDYEDTVTPQVVILEFVTCNKSERNSALKALVEKHKLKNTECSSYLDSDEYKLLIAEAPAVPDEFLVEAVQWEIKDMINFPLEEATLDVFSVPDQAANPNNVNVVVVKKNVIEEKVACFKEAKLNLTTIDIEELAFRNIAALQEIETQGSVILILRQNHGLVIFCKNGQIHFSRRLAIGYDDLHKDFDIIESIALEVQRSIDYFDRHFSSVSIRHLILLPYFSGRKNTIDFLDLNLSVSCVWANMSEGLKWLNPVDDDETSRCLLTLGTALREASNSQ